MILKVLRRYNRSPILFYWGFRLELFCYSLNEIKAYLADPSAFAAAATSASDDPAAAETAAAAAPAEEEEESDVDIGLDLFG
jgi:ribosomal protein L12E/L44/L45/RPP1/RPP2